MNMLETVILSLVEGITEFLPISSTGHLILVSHLLGIEQTNFTKSFEIIIQLGAIAAVVTQYSKTVLRNKAILLRLLCAFIPTAIIGFTLYPVIKHLFLESSRITLIALGLGGIFLILYEKYRRAPVQEINNIEELSLKKATLIGVAQSLSVIPGISRAGATIVGGLMTNLSREKAVEFSFLLAIPTMAAATGLDLIKTPIVAQGNELWLLFLGLIVSFISARLVVKFLLAFVRTNTFISFGIYRIIVAIIFWFILIR